MLFMNIQTIIALVIGIIIGSIGYSAFIPTHTMGDMPMDDHGAMGHTMDHKGIQADPEKPIPLVSITAQKDKMSGFNIHVRTDNYRVTPESAGADATQGEGHMHVFVNGVKAMRLYGEWAHLPGELFKNGENTISVTLNANDHSDWLIGDKHIEASTVVTK